MANITGQRPYAAACPRTRTTGSRVAVRPAMLARPAADAFGNAAVETRTWSSLVW